MQNCEKWTPALRQTENSDITTWELPDGAVARLGQGQIMDDITPQPIAPSPDGRYIAVGNRMGVWWYDVSTMIPVTLWDTGRGWITAISFSPNGKWLATGDGEGVVKVWDVQRGMCISQMKRDETKKTEQNVSGVNLVSHLVFSPDSRHLTSSVLRDYIVYVWQTETGDRVAKYHIETNFRWYRGKPRPIAFSADGTLLACTMPDYNLLACADSLDRIIRIPEHSFNYIAVWNMKTGEQIACLTEPTDFAVSLCFSPCGKLLASSEQKGAVRIWTLDNWKLKREFHNYGTDPKKVFYSSEGVLYAAEVSDDTFAVWDVESGEKSDTYLEAHHALQGNHLPKDCPLFSVTDKEFKVWKVGDSTPNTFSYLNIGIPNSLAFSQDGKTLAASCSGNTLMFWDTAKLSQPPKRFNKARGNFTFSMSPLGKLYATAPEQGTTKGRIISVWEIGKDKIPIASFTFPEQENPVALYSSVFAPTCNLIACGDNEGTLYVWDVAREKMLHQLKAHSSWIHFIAFSPNEKQLVSIRRAGPVSRMWDVESGEAIEAFPNKVTHIAFSPCSSIVACCGEREILLWDIEHREMIKTIPQPKDSWEQLYALAFSPCGRYLASGTWWNVWMDNMLIRLWDVESSENIVTFRGHSSDIQELTFSPDGTILASGSYDKTILLWDMKPYIGS